MVLLGFAAAFLYGAICILASVILEKLGVSKRLTRKFVHIMIGFEWAILYVFFGPGWYSFAVCAAFTALLVFAYYYKLMPAISSDGDNAPGTVYYGVSMTVMSFVSIFLPSLFLPFGAAVVCTSVGDGLAGVIGTYFGKRARKFIGGKTVVGFAANFVSSFGFLLLFSFFFNNFFSVTDALWIAALSATVEVVSSRGLDNITVPLSVCALTYLLVNASWINGYAVPIVLTPIVAAFVLERGVLSVRGVIAALIADAIVSVAFGNFGFIALLLFLALGAGSDKVKHIKSGKSDKSVRNEKQVMANSAVACLCALAYIFSPIPAFMAAFTVALAEALSDTVSSGIGALSANTYDIVRLKKCTRGISGGVSLIGTLSGVFAAFIIPLVALLFGTLGVVDMLIVSLFAFLGCILDSILGSLVQVKYRCKRCGAVTDNLVHCGAEGNKFSGISGIDNSMVNFLSSAICAILTMIVFIN